MLCRIAEPCNACYDNIYDQLNFEIKLQNIVNSIIYYKLNDENRRFVS